MEVVRCGNVERSELQSDENLKIEYELEGHDQENGNSILAKFENIEILGELQNGDVQLFSKDTKKTRVINLSRLTAIDVISLSGKNPGEDLAALKREIAFEARNKQIWRMKKIGQGIWKFDDDLLIVNGNEAVLWQDGKIIEQIETPIWNDFQIMFRAGAQWLDFNKIKLPSQQSFDDLKKIFEKWHWKNDLQTKIVTAQVIATLFQQIWPWRPHLYIIGRRNTGKSTLLKWMANIYGKIALPQEGNISEAGLRQSIQDDLVCVLLDEFEKFNSRNRDDILKLLRISNKGGVLTRGTKSGEALFFAMNHSVWLASIELALRDAADRSRFIIFELLPFDRGRLKLPTKKETLEMFHEIISTGLFYYKKFLECREKIIDDYDGELDTRLVECYSVPLSIIETITHEKGIELLKQIEKSQVASQIQEDEERLIETIVNTRVTIRNERFNDQNSKLITNDFTIGDLIEQSKSEKQLNESLKNYGISVTISKDQSVVAFHPQAVLREILKGTEWAYLSIKEILLRIHGAFESTVKFSGRGQRVVCIPINEVIKNDENNNQENDNIVPF